MQTKDRLRDIHIATIPNLPVQIWYMVDEKTYGPANDRHCDFLSTTETTLQATSLEGIKDQRKREVLQNYYADCFRSSHESITELRFEASKEMLSVTCVPIQISQETSSRLFIAQQHEYSPVPYSSIPIPDELIHKSLEGMKAGLWHWNIQSGETVFDETWARIVGHTLEELAPISIKTWETLTHPEDLKTAGQKLESYFRGETEAYECCLRMKHKAGHWVWILDRGTIFEYDEEGKPLLMSGTHVDISGQVALEDQLDQQSQFQWKASAFSAKLLQATPNNIDEMIDIELGEIGQFLGADRAYIFRFDPEVRIMINTHEWVAPGVSPEKENLQEVPVADFPFWMESINKNETIYIPQVSELDADREVLREVLEAQGINSLIVVPISGVRGPLGFLGLDFVTSSWGYTTFVEQVLVFTASIIARAIEAVENRARIEKMLDASEHSFREVTDQTRSLIMTTNQNFKTTYVNAAIVDTYGYLPEELVGKLPRQVLASPLKMVRSKSEVRDALLAKGTWYGRFINRTKDHRLVIESASISRLSPVGVTNTGFLKVGEDVTQSIKHEEWLKLLDQAHNVATGMLNSQFGFSKEFACLMSAIHEFTVPQSMFFFPYANENLTQLSFVSSEAKHPAEEIPVQARWLEDGFEKPVIFNSLEQTPNFDALPQQLEPFVRKGEAMLVEIASGRNKYGVLVCHHQLPVYYYDETDVDLFGSLAKILSQVISEMEISRFASLHSRTEQVTNLAAGLAHEVRNPLAVISMGMEVIEQQCLGSQGQVEKAVKVIKDSVLRANTIVENLMKLEMPSDTGSENSMLVLADILDESIALVTFHLRSQKINVTLNDFDRDLKVMGGKEGLLKVFVNILLNAIQAMGSGGKLVISVRSTTSEDVEITFRDNGVGITPENLSRVLDPFFSTKKDRHGSGMGLYICKGIVEETGGSIGVESTLGEGTTVTVKLNRKGE